MSDEAKAEESKIAVELEDKKPTLAMMNGNHVLISIPINHTKRVVAFGMILESIYKLFRLYNAMDDLKVQEQAKKGTLLDRGAAAFKAMIDGKA